jgi:hypothetical protein
VLVSGGRLLNVISQVRFLPPQLPVPLAERLKGTGLPNRTGGFDSRRALRKKTIGDRSMAGRLALNQEMRVQFLLPELHGLITPGQLLLVVTLGSEPRGRWFDSSPRNCLRANARKSSGRMRNLSRKQAAT